MVVGSEKREHVVDLVVDLVHEKSSQRTQHHLETPLPKRDWKDIYVRYGREKKLETIILVNVKEISY